jgi:type IV secretion system protein TrbG
MKWFPLPLLLLASGLTGCGDGGDVQPVEVATPGLPSPELALQRSLDRVHGFMESLNQRLPTPARASVPLAVTAAIPQSARPADVPQAPSPSFPAGTPHEASPLYGKGGIVWFGFGDGYSRVHCAPQSTCVIRLQPGENVDRSLASIGEQSGWRFTVIRGTRGIHAAPALVVDPSGNVEETVLHVATDRRSYAIGLVPGGPSMSTVAFAYAATDPKQQAEPPIADAGTMKPDFGFRITGPDVPWKPLRVYRDGGKTYVQFPPGGILTEPRVTILAPQHQTPEVRRSVADSYVVDGVVDDMLLSVGDGADRVTVRIQHQTETGHA